MDAGANYGGLFWGEVEHLHQENKENYVKP
jgi:hypothetical protein